MHLTSSLTQNDPSSERSVEKDETRVVRGGAFTNPPARCSQPTALSTCLLFSM